MNGPAGLGAPPRFLTDVNFNHHIIAGLWRRQPDVDVMTAQELGFHTIADPELLARAREFNRILLTHDINTMQARFNDFLSQLAEGEHSPGVMYIPQKLPIGIAIDALFVVLACSVHEEWQDRFTYLPL